MKICSGLISSGCSFGNAFGRHSSLLHLFLSTKYKATGGEKAVDNPGSMVKMVREVPGFADMMGIPSGRAGIPKRNS